MRPRLQCVWLLMISLLPMGRANAYDFENGGIYYSVTSTVDYTCGVTNNINGSRPPYYSAPYRGKVIIPDTVVYNGKKLTVTSIEKDAFWDSEITSVYIPPTIRRIESGAFYDCESLTGVYISDLSAWCKIRFVDNPLKYAHKLHLNDELVTDLAIPDDITRINEYAFEHCRSLLSVSMHDGVLSIGYCAFYGCTQLKTVRLPISMSKMGHGTFMNCSSLEEVVVPEGIKEVEYSMFNGCRALRSVKIPATVQHIGKQAFAGCVALDSISLSDMSAWCEIEFEDTPLKYARNLYLNGDLLDTLIVPDDVVRVSDKAFKHADCLKSVTIGGGVTEIGDSAFYGCVNVDSVYIPERVQRLGYVAFDGVRSVRSDSQSVNFRDYKSTENLYCDFVKEVYCKGSSGLKSVSMSGAELVSADSFENCTKLSSVTFGDKLGSIEDRAFYNCGSLETLFIPRSCRQIGRYAFGLCLSLREVVFEDSNTPILVEGSYQWNGSIGGASFWRCWALKSVYLGRVLNTLHTPYTNYGLRVKSKTPWPDSKVTDVTIAGTYSYFDMYYFYEGEEFTGRNTILRKLDLGENLNELRVVSGNLTAELDTIVSRNPIPPKTSEFDQKAYINTLLIVPSGSKDFYHSSDIWKKFWNVEEREMSEAGSVEAEDYSWRICREGTAIKILGLKNRLQIEVYNVCGALAYSGFNTEIRIGKSGIYIVKIGNITRKIIL